MPAPLPGEGGALDNRRDVATRPGGPRGADRKADERVGRPARSPRQPLPARGGARQQPARARDARPGRDAAARRGAAPRRAAEPQPGDLRHHLDGARGPAGDRREPPPQLHRPRRVSPQRRDRAALHPDAGRPLPRARRDHGREHAGVVGGDHARRSLAQVEMARAARAGRAGDRAPNLVFGGDVHVVWEKFCRYFDVEPRIIPLQPDKYTIGPEDVEPHLDENTIGVAAVLGTTFTGHADDIRGINDLLVSLKHDRGLDVPLHVDAASGGFVWPFLYPDSEWDFRLEQVRSINVSGHKFGLVYPGIGWLVFRELDDLPEDLVFYENYLGKRDATFTLNFSTGAAMVLAQYYNFVRFGHDGYRYIMETMQANAQVLAEKIAAIGDFRIIGSETAEQLPLVAFQLDGDHHYDEFDVAAQLAAERGWMVPAYTLPPEADHIKIMRALVKLTLGHSLVETLADDIAMACSVLAEKGGLHTHDRKRVKTGTGY